jgi:hypothetical protein
LPRWLVVLASGKDCAGMMSALTGEQPVERSIRRPQSPAARARRRKGTILTIEA